MHGPFAARRRSSLYCCGTALVALTLACTPSPVRTGIAPTAVTPDTIRVHGLEGRTLENLLAGRVAGVTASQTGSRGLQIRIRGSDLPPLVVVDGTEIDNQTGSISLLNTYDVERIEVLKNPADVAVYGSRGANGVVLITTRRPGTR